MTTVDVSATLQFPVTLTVSAPVTIEFIASDGLVHQIVGMDAFFGGV